MGFPLESLFFALLGMGIEVAWTAFDGWVAVIWLRLRETVPIPDDLLDSAREAAKEAKMAVGHSTLWVAPLYAAYPLGMEALAAAGVLDWPLPARLCWYAATALGVEYSAGRALRWLLGECPWRYDTGWHLDGLVRLDWLPLWALIGLGAQHLHQILHAVR